MRYTILAVLLLLSNHLLSQKSDANIYGHVVDAKTHEHLPFVSIQIDGTSIGVNTDHSGHFFIKNLPVGTHRLIVKALGYVQMEKQVRVERQKTVEVNFELKSANLSIGEVVVSSNRKEVNRRSSPVAINTISSGIFVNTSSSRLSEGLVFTPGLRIENNCQNCGFNQLRINGLPGEYSQILIDGRPIFSGAAVVYGLEQIPAAMVERVEVIKGGGSSVYGSNAIAGTVNVITKEPASNSWGVGGMTGTFGKSTFDKEASFNTSVVDESFRSGISIFGLVKDRDAYDVDGDGFSEIPLLKNTGVGIRSFFKPSLNTRIGLEFHHLRETRRGGDQLEASPHLTNITEMVEHNINGASVGFDFLSDTKEHKVSVYASGQHLARDSYYGAEMDPSGYGVTSDLATSVGASYTLAKKEWRMPTTFIVGLERNGNDVFDRKRGYISNEGVKIPRTVIAKQSNETFAGYAQLVAELGGWGKFQLGGRADRYDIVDRETGTGSNSGVEITPSASLLVSWDSQSRWQSRLSFAKGFRAPQIFSEDLHVDLQGARRIETKLGDDLKVETSNSYVFSTSYSDSEARMPILLSVDGFFTSIQDPFLDVFSEVDENGVKIVEKRNAPDALVYGVNMEGTVQFSFRSNLEAGFTLQRSRYRQATQWGDLESSTSKSILRTPDAYGYVVLILGLPKNLTLSLNGTYTGPMWVPHRAIARADATPSQLDAINRGWIKDREELVRTKVFFDVGAKLGYLFYPSSSVSCTVEVGLKNAFNSYQRDFDKGVYRDSEYIYGPSLPRFAYISLKFGSIL